MASTALVSIDCEKVTGELKHIWASIGFDEINWSYTERGKDLLRILKDEVVQTPYHVRNHNTFTSGNCLGFPSASSTNIYIEDGSGQPTFNFDIIDQIYDNYVANNFIPIVELAFMPYDLVPKPHKSAYDTDGWKYPPNDYQKWYNLVRTFLIHLSERYGKQIENWYFELWNEPDITAYWLGTVEDYCKLYDYSVDAVKSVNPNLKIGGPATTSGGNNFLNQFLQHVTSGTNYFNQQIGTKIDFISFHSKGSAYNPEHAYGHKVPLQYPSIERVVGNITNSLNVISKYPTLNDIPVIVDECDAVVDHRYGMYDNPNYVVNNTEYYPSIVAAMIYNIPLVAPRITLITHWAFYMEGKRFFEGTRTLVTNYNLYLPILNGLKLFEKLKTNKLSIEITNNNIPLNGICTIDNGDIQLLLFSHVDDYTVNQNQNLTIILKNITSKFVLVRHYKIDANNNNIYSEWIKMGKPNYLNAEQLAYFQNYQQLKVLNPPEIYQVENNQLTLDSLNITTHSTDFFEIVNLD